MNGQLKEDMANCSNEFADWSSPDKIFWMLWFSEVSVLQLGDKCVVHQKTTFFTVYTSSATFEIRTVYEAANLG